MVVQIANPVDNHRAIDAHHAPTHRGFQVQADPAFVVASDVLAVIVYGGGVDRAARHVGGRAVRQRLVEFVDQVVVWVEAGVAGCLAQAGAAAVDAEGLGVGNRDEGGEEEGVYGGGSHFGIGREMDI